jgi:modification target Cys-rich repeat protein
MNTTKKFRIAALPALAATIAAPFVLGAGCGDDLNPLGAICCEDFKPGTNMLEVDWGLEGQLNADFGVAIQAIGDFSASVTAMMNDLGSTCRSMAVELGTAEDAVTTADPAEYTTQWCSLAAQAIGTLKGNASITINAQPPQCSVSANVQASCEGSCKVDASCTEPEIDVRCDPGQLSVKCEGSCSGSCEGSANVAVACEGTCEGTCEGECQGQCSATNADGSCAGSCSGTCTGSCRGSCAVAADANLECEGECTGGCEGTATAPKCKGELSPPTCEGSADCQASCKASASAKAECTPPAVTLSVTGDIDAKGLAVLEKYLPQILLVVEGRGKLLLDNAEAMVSVSANLDGALEGDGKAVFCIIPAAAAITGALTNIQATVTAAGSVTASLN